MHIKANTALYNKELIKLVLVLLSCQYAFSNNVEKNWKNHNKNPNINICFFYIWSEILFLSQDAMLKVSKTTYSQKLFSSDCKSHCMRKVQSLKRNNILQNKFNQVYLEMQAKINCSILFYSEQFRVRRFFYSRAQTS